MRGSTSLSLPFLTLCAGALALIVAVWMVFNAAFFDPVGRTGERITALRQDLSQLSVRNAALNAEVNVTPAAAEGTPATLVHTAPSAAISSEAFQQEIRNEIANVHGTSISSQANTQNMPGGTAKIRVLLRARVDELGLLKFTRAIESGTPPMIFESFEVHPVPVGQAPGLLEFTGMLVGFHSDAR